MRIALDYDDTYTKDPTLWNKFINLVRSRHHEIVICTCRGTLYNEDMIFPSNMIIYYTSGKSKKPYMESIGIKIDVWIDDCPEMLLDVPLSEEEW